MVTISVILPVYNAADYLAEAIESILNQSFRDFELLIINDGSTDYSKNVIQSFSDSRIKYIENKGNQGLIYTLNRGLKESTGKYIARMDADDISLSQRFEKQVQFMENHPEIGACGTYAEYIGDRQGFWKYPINDKDIRCRLMWGSAIIHPTAFIRTMVLHKHQILFNREYVASEDFKLWVDLSEHSQLYNIPEVLLKYRSHGSQVTTTKLDTMNNTKCRIIIEQLTSMTLKISEIEKNIISRFILYTYNFNKKELQTLFDIYLNFIHTNKQVLKYDPATINCQIENRLFEACYFSTKKCGLDAIKIHKKYFTFKPLGLKTTLKFYIKGILRL